MKINLSLSTKSIDNAIKQLNKVKNLMPKIEKEYLYKCALKIKAMAKLNLENSGIGRGVIDEIDRETVITKTINGYKISWGGKAPYIEFGTGIKGQGTYDVNSAVVPILNYDYNVSSNYKDSNGAWIFKPLDKNNIDIKKENIINETTNTIKTQGNEASLFVYNAIIDFKITGVYKKIWEEM